MFDITYGAAALAGLLSFLSPCILPIVPFYLCYLAGVSMSELQGQSELPRAARRRIVISTLFFAAGIITIFMGLGASFSAFGQFLGAYMDSLRWIAGGIIIVMGLHFTGLLRIPLLYREARIETNNQSPASYLGAFVIGLAFAFGWTPCVGPALAAILITAGGQDTALKGAMLLLVYGVGMTAPFVVAAAFAGPFMKAVGRFRAYMGYVEKAMGVLLILFGLLIITGRINRIAEWMLEIAPDIGVLQ